MHIKQLLRWIAFIAITIPGAGCVVVPPPPELDLDEHTDADISNLCASYQHGLATCAQGYRAGFVDERACMEAVTDLRGAEFQDFACQAMTSEDIQACLRLEPCARLEAPECEIFYRCLAEVRQAQELPPAEVE